MRAVGKLWIGTWVIAILMSELTLAQAQGTTPPTRADIVKKIIDASAQETTTKLLDALQQVDIAQQNKVSKKATKTLNGNQLISIGTGAVGGNYFVLGELVGGVISHPRGSLSCGNGGTCGIPNTQSMNITSAGSMANLSAIGAGALTTGFVQSDVAYWAYTGTGLFNNNNKMQDLRAVASLYPEAVHIVVNKKANINSVEDLVGKRVSVGARRSGTILQSRLVLQAYQLSVDQLEAEYLNNQASIAKLKNGELDAMFFSVGAPAPSLIQLFNDSEDFSLLPINTRARQAILAKGSYFSPFIIEEGTYPNIGKVETVSVFALWLCSAKQDPELIYQMTKALWSDSARQLFNSSIIGQKIHVDNSLQGIGIPLHEGAKRYYNEIGKRY